MRSSNRPLCEGSGSWARWAFERIPAERSGSFRRGQCVVPANAPAHFDERAGKQARDVRL
jgi:hypothetical protein